MVAQDDIDDEGEAGRFPLGAPASASTEPVVQVEIDVEKGASLAAAATRIDLAAPAAAGASASTPGLDLFAAALRDVRAVRVDWSFDFTSNKIASLSPAEMVRRRSLLDVTLPSGVDVNKAADTLRNLPFVVRAVPRPEEAPPWSYPDEPLVGLDDQDLEHQWYLFRVGAHHAWKKATGRDVVIADVDFGFLTTHNDLTNIEADRQYNSHDGSTNVSCGRHISHGTAVLGLAGAASNGAGMVGIAHDSKLWPIQANAGAGHRIKGDKWARGIDWVRESDSGGRRKVVILEVQTSRGRCYEMVGSTRLAIQQAIDHGVVVVVAAGNGGADVSLGDDDTPYPESGSILVGATAFHRRYNPRACFSNFGERLTISAPGYGPADLTCSAKAPDQYRLGFGGTSGAAPKVAGACALLLERNPGLTHHDVKAMLVKSGDEVVTSPNRPAGVFLNLESALDLAR